MTWEDRIREILQWLCVWFTGAPCGSGDNSSLGDLIDEVAAAHAANGCPQGTDDDAKTKLKDLWDLIHDPESTLTAAQATTLKNIVTDCYAAVGGDPSSLP